MFRAIQNEEKNTSVPAKRDVYKEVKELIEQERKHIHSKQRHYFFGVFQFRPSNVPLTPDQSQLAQILKILRNPEHANPDDLKMLENSLIQQPGVEFEDMQRKSQLNNLLSARNFNSLVSLICALSVDPVRATAQLKGQPLASSNSGPNLSATDKDYPRELRTA